MKTTSAARVVSLCGASAPSGQTRRPASLAPRMIFDPREPRKLRLTARELEVLSLLCEGLSNKLICRRLGICSGTVKCHVASILNTLGVSSRLQAVVTAHRLGLLEDARGAKDQEDASEAEDADSVEEPRIQTMRTAQPMSAAA